MEDPREHMDKIRIWFSALATLIENEGVRCVAYLGPVETAPSLPDSSRVRLFLVAEGEAGPFSYAGERLTVAANHAGICCGVEADWPAVCFSACGWCVDLDISGQDAFVSLCAEPLLLAFPVRFFAWMRGAFFSAAKRCNRGDHESGAIFYGERVDPDSLRGSHRLAAQAALLELMTSFLSAIEIVEGIVRSLRSPVVGDALEFMACHYNDPELSLDDIAAAVHLSVQQFGRRFRDETGESPMQHLRALRMRHAAARLRETRHSIAEVAEAVGIADALYFSRIFRKTYGCSPTDYRNSGTP